jgi:glycerol-3-phosphate O-acyltransferase
MSGTKKAASNLGGIFKSRSLIKRRYGRIYVNFGTPMSTREYAESLSDESMGAEEQQKVTVQSLAENLIQSINRNQVVTPFSLMAAALLTSPHKAISYSELLTALALYYQYLDEIDARFAETLENFTRATQDVIAYYQQRNLIDVEEGEETEEALFTVPEDNRLSLEMYKNMILHHFLPISFVSLGLLSADYGECMESKVREDYTVLKDLLKHDFVYDEREDDHAWIENCLQFLEKGRHLEVFAINGTRKYKVTGKGREEMVYFAAMLTNFLEAYGILLNVVPRLGEKPETEKEFMARLRKTGQRLYKQGQVMRPEALSQLIYKNALQYVREQEMVVQKEQAKGKPLLIMDVSKENLRNELLTHISKFIRVEKYHYLSR